MPGMRQLVLDTDSSLIFVVAPELAYGPRSAGAISLVPGGAGLLSSTSGLSVSTLECCCYSTHFSLQAVPDQPCDYRNFRELGALGVAT